jgi:hypothetical protein
MPPASQPIDVLSVEDHPGDGLMTRKACGHNKIRNTLLVARGGLEVQPKPNGASSFLAKHDTPHCR